MLNRPRSSIYEIFDIADGKYRAAETLLSAPDSTVHRERAEIRRQHIVARRQEGQERFLCAGCMRPVHICGWNLQGRHGYWFKHFERDPDCPMEGGDRLTAEEIRANKYHGLPEGREHRETKAFLLAVLQKDPFASNPRAERVVKGRFAYKEWRRPDIAFETPEGRTVVIEIQRSTEFVSVIQAREEFYERHGTSILWLFTNIDQERFTFKDIFYNGKRNAFTLNWKRSREENRLWLRCIYHVPRILNDWRVEATPEEREACLSVLQFDPVTHKPFVYDFEAASAELLLASRAKEENQLPESFGTAWRAYRECPDDDELKDNLLVQCWILRQRKLLPTGTDLPHGSIRTWLDLMYSAQQGYVVGFGFPNYIQIVNHALRVGNSHPHGVAFLSVLHAYGNDGVFPAGKHTRSFSEWQTEFRTQRRSGAPSHQHDPQFDDLFQFLFPKAVPNLVKALSKKCG